MDVFLRTGREFYSRAGETTKAQRGKGKALRLKNLQSYFFFAFFLAFFLAMV
jgi:hypothetical protein